MQEGGLMSNSVRHRELRQSRAKQKQYENRVKRNATRRNIVLESEPMSLKISQGPKKKHWWLPLSERISKGSKEK